MWAAVLSAKLALGTLPYLLGTALVDAALTNNNTVTLVAPLVVLILAGFFTLRSNVAKIWKDNYEAKVEEAKVLVQERDQQRELKHQALTENATLKNQLLVEQSKTDLSGLVVKLDEQSVLLERILAAITADSINQRKD